MIKLFIVSIDTFNKLIETLNVPDLGNTYMATYILANIFVYLAIYLLAKLIIYTLKTLFKKPSWLVR